MRMILTEKELAISRAIQEQLNGVTFDEAIHAIAHARGAIGLQRSEMKQKPQAKIDGLGRCGTCKHWQRYSDKFDVTAHGKHAGVCNSEKFVCQENTQKEQDSLRCWGYEGDGAFNTGEDFGCVHWTKHPMERWVR